MGTRTVRLDGESERLLKEVCSEKGLSVSSALKAGLVALREAMDAEGPSVNPSAVYGQLDIGPGGRSRVVARRAKAGLSEVLRRKARR